MDEKRLAAALSGLLGPTLSTELVADLVKIRRDLATRTLERSALGKFVETFVQCLQHMDKGTHDAKPSVDDYLDKKAENTSLPEGLRIVAARVARAMYTLRNKRNIAHKNDVDTNTHDLALAHCQRSFNCPQLRSLKIPHPGRLFQFTAVDSSVRMSPALSFSLSR